VSATTIECGQLLAAMFGSQSHFSGREIRQKPGQRTGSTFIHVRFCGDIVAGSANYQVEARRPRYYTCQRSMSRWGKIIADFSNAFDLEPLIFAAFYLKDGDRNLITMLDEG
jgi:hypothetical protein